MKKAALKRGMAVPMVIFFAFAIFIGFLVISRSNIDIASQNKLTIRQMQVYYLAHSAMQHAKLHIRLMPIETFKFFNENGDPSVALKHIDSDCYGPLCMQRKKGYDLFIKADDLSFPYQGQYWVDRLEHLAAHDGMKLVQDSYKVVVSAEVNRDTKQAFSLDGLNEELLVSRSVGGISEK